METPLIAWSCAPNRTTSSWFRARPMTRERPKWIHQIQSCWWTILWNGIKVMGRRIWRWYEWQRCVRQIYQTNFTEMAPHSHNIANAVAKNGRATKPRCLPTIWLYTNRSRWELDWQKYIRNYGNSRYTRSLSFEANIRPKQNTVLYTTSTGDHWKIGSSTLDERRRHQRLAIAVQHLLDKKAIEDIPFDRMKFQTYLFPLKQHDKVRAILDCSELNKHITYNHFKMEELPHMRHMKHKTIGWSKSIWSMFIYIYLYILNTDLW